MLAGNAHTVSASAASRVYNRIVAETRGNPPQLLELPREMRTAALSGGFGVSPMGTAAT